MKIRLGDISNTRSGDKGANSNVGIIFKNKFIYEWALKNLSEKIIKEYFKDMVKGNVIRYLLPNINAINYILYDSLGGGGSESLINDAQGKTHGQALAMMEVDIPEKIINKE